MPSHHFDPTAWAVVSLDDGSTVSCAASIVGRTRQKRWIVRTAKGVELIGPPAACARNRAELESLLSDWWQLRTALGYTALNAELLRNQLRQTEN